MTFVGGMSPPIDRRSAQVEIGSGFTQVENCAGNARVIGAEP
jgi:hypothetical protein